MVPVCMIIKKPLLFIVKKEYVCFNRQLILQELRIGTLVALQEFLVGVGKVDYANSNTLSCFMYRKRVQ